MTRVMVSAFALMLAGCAKPDPASEQARLEREFEQSLTNVALAGKFSVRDRIVEDRYQISKVSKLTGDTWLIHAKIGKSDVSVPVPVTVKWAGDTPVMQLTNVGIPGMGSYSARVLFYKDQYAGTWSSKDHGGEMWGRLVRQ